jgi:transcriptional regulator with XRE-family HTH domain
MKNIGARKMFRKWLYEQIQKREMTQRELAGKLGVDESLVSRWMKGERPVTLPNIIKMAKLFNTTTDEILSVMGKLDV